MNKIKWYPLVIFIVLGALFLNACNPTSQDTPTATAPQPSFTAIPTLTAVPPTVVVPSATPSPIPTNAYITNILDSGVLQFGDVVRGLAFTQDGSTLAAAGGNSGETAIQLWDMANGQPLGSLNGHTDIVWDVAFSPDDQMLASVSSDLTAKVWNWRNGDLVKSLDFPGQPVSVSFSPDGQSLAVGGVDTPQNQVQNAAVWTFSVGSWAPVLKLSEYMNISAMAYSPSGDVLVGGGTSRNLQVWRTSDGAPLYTLSHAHQVAETVISPDGSTLATATCLTTAGYDCTEGGVWLWDFHTGKLIQKLGGFPNFVEDLVFIPNGSDLIVISRDGTLRVYETSTYQVRHEATSLGQLSALAISPVGNLLAYGTSSGGIYLLALYYD